MFWANRAPHTRVRFTKCRGRQDRVMPAATRSPCTSIRFTKDLVPWARVRPGVGIASQTRVRIANGTAFRTRLGPVGLSGLGLQQIGLTG